MNHSSSFNQPYCVKTTLLSMPWFPSHSSVGFLIKLWLSLLVFCFFIFIHVSLKWGYSTQFYSLSSFSLSKFSFKPSTSASVCIWRDLPNRHAWSNFSVLCSLPQISIWISHRISNSLCSKLNANDNFKIEEIVHWENRREIM